MHIYIYIYIYALIYLSIYRIAKISSNCTLCAQVYELTFSHWWTSC